MKRSKPLRSNPQKIRAWKERSKSFPQKHYADLRNAQLRNEWPKTKPPADLIPEEVRKAVKARADNRCERCRGFCSHPHLHHVKLRSQDGGHTPDNLLALCDGCHGIVHSRPKDSHQEGTLYSGKWARTIPWLFILDRRDASWRDGPMNW